MTQTQAKDIQDYLVITHKNIDIENIILNISKNILKTDLENNYNQQILMALNLTQDIVRKKEGNIKQNLLDEIQKANIIISQRAYLLNPEKKLEQHLKENFENLSKNKVDLRIFEIVRGGEVTNALTYISSLMKYSSNESTDEERKRILNLVSNNNKSTISKKQETFIRDEDIKTFIEYFSSFDPIARNVDYFVKACESEMREWTLLKSTLNYFVNLELSTINIQDYAKYQMGLKPLSIGVRGEETPPFAYYFSGIEIEDIINPTLTRIGIRNEEIRNQLIISWVKNTKHLSLEDKFKPIKKDKYGIPFANFLTSVGKYKNELSN